MMNKIVQQDPPLIKGNYCDFLKQLAFDLLEKDPNKRLPIHELMLKREIQTEINKIKEKLNIGQEKTSKISFQDYLKKLESEENHYFSNQQNPPKDQLENDRTLTKKNNGKISTLINQENIEFPQNSQKQFNISGKISQKPPRQTTKDIPSNNSPINQNADGIKTRSHSLNNKGEADKILKEININMETVIKHKDLCKKTIDKNKEETIINFAQFIKGETEQNHINNRTQNIHKNNEGLLRKHNRRCSINTKPDSQNNSQFFNGHLYKNVENQENLKKISIEFLRKIFDANAPLASKRKILLRDFLNKKLGKKLCENVENLIKKNNGEPVNYSNREVLNSKILEIIGKENENYILVFNYLFNPECLYSMKKVKN